jgi:hypothetical protein
MRGRHGATIGKERTLETPAVEAWEALKDFHAATSVAAGCVVKCVSDGSARVTALSNGAEAREEFVII